MDYSMDRCPVMCTNFSDLESNSSDVENPELPIMASSYNRIMERVERLTLEAKHLRENVAKDIAEDFKDIGFRVGKAEREINDITEDTQVVCQELQVEGFVEDMITRLENYGGTLRRVAYHVDSVFPHVFPQGRDVTENTPSQKPSSRFISPTKPPKPTIKTGSNVSKSKRVKDYAVSHSKSEDLCVQGQPFFTEIVEPPQPLSCSQLFPKSERSSEKVWMEHYQGIVEEDSDEPDNELYHVD